MLCSLQIKNTSKNLVIIMSINTYLSLIFCYFANSCITLSIMIKIECAKNKIKFPFLNIIVIHGKLNFFSLRYQIGTESKSIFKLKHYLTSFIMLPKQSGVSIDNLSLSIYKKKLFFKITHHLTLSSMV